MSETTAAALHRRGVLARNMPRAGAASRPPFFYFHGDYEGGGFYCLALAGHTGPDQPFYAVAPPGHDGGPIPPDVPAIAEMHLAMLRGLQPAGPYRLGGFCNGGLVAFEIARRLVAAGEQVERLVLIAPVVPTAGGPLARLADRARNLREYYVAQMRLLLAQPMGAQVRYLGARARSMLRLGPAPAVPGTGVPPPPMDEARQRSETYMRSVHFYRPVPYAGPVDIIWPAREKRRKRRRAMGEWRRMLTRMRVHRVPGTHSTCLRQEAAALGATLRACLRGRD